MTTSSKNIPAVGTPATFCIGGDRYSGSIKEIHRNGRTIVFERSNAVRSEQVFTLRKNGQYIEKGCDCGSLSIGSAVDHWDPHF